MSTDTRSSGRQARGWVRGALLGLGLVGAALLTTVPAAAHDDPVLTVKLLCGGLNAQDREAVFTELDDTASIQFDRSVRGKQQVQAWVDEQFAHNLHCQVGDIQDPERLSNGNAITWSATFMRDDWVADRALTEHLVIQNARITEWTSTQGTAAGTAVESGQGTLSQPIGVRRVLQAREGALPADSASTGATTIVQTTSGSGDIPPTLIAAGVVAVVGLAWAARELAVSRRARRRAAGPTIPRL